jgi:Spy/CpxP family protein refolding chaperone
MKRFTLVVLFLFVVAGLAEAEAEPPDAAKAKAMGLDKVQVIEVPATKAKVQGRGGPRDSTALWWNDPGIIKALSITEQQRKKMSELQKAYRKNVPKDRRPDAFHETLVQGDWKKARAASDKVVKLAADSVRLRGALKIDVLSLLSDEQRQKLIDQYPRLIYKPWRRAMRDDPAS